MNGPWGVAVDGAGNVWVADSGNNFIRVSDRVRKFTARIVGNHDPQAERIGDGTRRRVPRS